jgi:alkanesulfonate monooxygenase SsuD/methylene tetrahydromethanopterin reductase-like flavin-dependent oxidoreductase (luciferase family)
MGQDFSTRGKRSDEILEILRLLWTGEMVEYQGKYYQFDRMEMNPAPNKHIPIWIGGISDPAMRRAARVGDGWVTDLQSSDDIIASIKKIQAWRREYGVDNTSFDIMATPSDAYDPDGYKRLEDAGVTHILTMPWPFYHGDTQDLDKKIDGVKRYADEVIAKCQ